MSSGDSCKCSNGQKLSKDVETGSKNEDIDLRLHKHPIITIYYAFMESIYLIMQFVAYLLSHKRIIIIVLLSTFSLLMVNLFEGVHRRILFEVIKKFHWWGWWVFLGFLSSCGFGSGLHTFVLYLGPFIARVTMAAYECGTTNFPEPPYPIEFLCPEQNSKITMTTLKIVQKVLIESVLWGVGTAIGELPPYFMARAAALSGSSNSNEYYFEANKIDEPSWHSRAQLMMKTIVQKVGFFGIMLCASIPNPLFDLAGMTCGHFLVPFSTFFGATLIGKAINKMAIQMVFVVLIFSQEEVVWFQSLIKKIPYYGSALNSLIDEFLMQQKEKIHKSIVTDKQSWLQIIFSYIQMIIILGFVVSIIHSLAENYSVRLQKWKTNYNQYLSSISPKSQHSKVKKDH